MYKTEGACAMIVSLLGCIMIPVGFVLFAAGGAVSVATFGASYALAMVGIGFFTFAGAMGVIMIGNCMSQNARNTVQQEIHNHPDIVAILARCPGVHLEIDQKQHVTYSSKGRAQVRSTLCICVCLVTAPSEMCV